MFYLAKTDASVYTSIEEISHHEHIPKRFLEHILAELKRNHFLKSKVGAHGGYKLATTPDKISVGEIIRTLDGLLEPETCIRNSNEEVCEDCPNIAQCNVRLVLKRMLHTTEYILNNTTLCDANKLVLNLQLTV